MLLKIVYNDFSQKLRESNYYGLYYYHIVFKILL